MFMLHFESPRRDTIVDICGNASSIYNIWFVFSETYNINDCRCIITDSHGIKCDPKQGESLPPM